MLKRYLSHFLSFILVVSLVLSLVACHQNGDKTGNESEQASEETNDQLDTVAPPTSPKDANGVACPKCGEEKCDVFSRASIQGYRCRVCATEFGFFRPSTVEVMTDNKGFYLVKNNNLYNVMFTTYYFQDSDHFFAPEFRIYDLQREEYDGFIVFNSLNGWARLLVENVENGVSTGQGLIDFDNIEMEIGDATCSSVSSEQTPEGQNLFGEQGVSYFSNESNEDIHYIACEEGNLKLDLSSFTENSRFQNLYIQNPVVIRGVMNDEESPVNGSNMFILSGHDKDIYMTITIRTEQVIQGEDRIIILQSVSFNGVDNVDGARFILENQLMSYMVIANS